VNFSAFARAAALLLTGALMMGWTGVASADDETDIDNMMAMATRGDLELGWSGSITASYFARRGNSREEDWGLALGWAYNHDSPWQFDGTISGESESTNQDTSDESYEFKNAAKYYKTETTYYVGRANYEKDRFSGIEEEAAGVIGYGRELFKKGNHRIIGEGGGGFLWSKDADGESDQGLTGYVAGFYRWQLTEHSKFRQLISARYSEFDQNWKLNSVSEISSNIIGNLEALFTYEIKRNSEVPSGTANSDFYTNLGLKYSF
jgi:putative salt-induced outer membrane protein